MTYFMVDIEADGPIPGDYSMVCFGAIIVEPTLDRTFYGQLNPISEAWIPEALAVSGFSREETLAFDDPEAGDAQLRPMGQRQLCWPSYFYLRQQRFRLAVYQLVLPSLHRQEPIWLQFNELGLTLQGCGEGLASQFQALAKNAAHASPCRRRSR